MVWVSDYNGKQALAAKFKIGMIEDQNSDGPLIDTINIAVKNLIKKGRIDSLRLARSTPPSRKLN